MSSSIEMEGMKVTYKFDVPSTIGPDKIKASIDAHSDSKINEMLTMHIGTCADYTVTVATSPVTSMGNTVDSDGNAVTMVASEGNEVTADDGGSETATTVEPTSGDGAESATTAEAANVATSSTAAVSGPADDTATSDARSESIMVIAVMATAATW
jgi:hypothetical protein